MSLLLDAIKKASKDRAAQKKAKAAAEKSDDTALTGFSAESSADDEDKTVFKMPGESDDDTQLNAVSESNSPEASAHKKKQPLDRGEDDITSLDYPETDNVSASGASADGRSDAADDTQIGIDDVSVLASAALSDDANDVMLNSEAEKLAAEKHKNKAHDDTTFIEYDEKNEAVEDGELRLAEDTNFLEQKTSSPQDDTKNPADLIGQVLQSRPADSAVVAPGNDEVSNHVSAEQTDTKTSLTGRLKQMRDIELPTAYKEDKEATSYSHAKTITGFTSKAAKNVFASKSKREKLQGRNALIYTSLGLVVAISVFIFIYYAEKIDDIDSDLVRYQRDPAVKNLSLAERNRLNAARVNKNASKLAPRKDKQKKYGATRVANSGDVGVAQQGTKKLSQGDKPGESAVALVKKQKQKIKISSRVRKPEKSVKVNDAYALYIAGDYEAAKAAYQSLLANGEETQGAMHGLAAINLREGNISAAKTGYLKLLEINPKDVVAGAGLLSISELKSSASRETALKLMLAEKPGSAYLHAELGNAYSAKQRWSAAQSSYFEAAKLQPNNAAYAVNLAVSLDQLGKADAAVQYYQRAIGLSDGVDVSFDVQAIKARVNTLKDGAQGSSNK